jgi:hypothetical protein
MRASISSVITSRLDHIARLAALPGAAAARLCDEME